MSGVIDIVFFSDSQKVPLLVCEAIDLRESSLLIETPTGARLEGIDISIRPSQKRKLFAAYSHVRVVSMKGKDPEKFGTLDLQPLS